MKKVYFDEEEKQLAESWEKGEFRPAGNQKAVRQSVVQAAKRYVRKDARINIRLSSADLEMIKRKAVEEGLPYQSLIASVLHKFVSVTRPIVPEQSERVTESLSNIKQAT